METTYADSWSGMAQPCDMDLWVMKWRSAWPIFHGPVILPYILKTIWCMYIILWEYESVWSSIWPQIKCRSLWPIFHGPVILPYILKTIWWLNILIWDYESVWPNVWPKNKCKWLWPTFHGPRYFTPRKYWLSTQEAMAPSRHDWKIVDWDVKPQHNQPTNFMVHWFCIISWRLFDVWTSYFGIMGHMTRHLTAK